MEEREDEKWHTSRAVCKPRVRSNSSSDMARPEDTSVTSPVAGGCATEESLSGPGSPSITKIWPVLRSLIVNFCPPRRNQKGDRVSSRRRHLKKKSPQEASSKNDKDGLDHENQGPHDVEALYQTLGVPP